MGGRRDGWSEDKKQEDDGIISKTMKWDGKSSELREVRLVKTSGEKEERWLESSEWKNELIDKKGKWTSLKREIDEWKGERIEFVEIWEQSKLERDKTIVAQEW